MRERKWRRQAAATLAFAAAGTSADSKKGSIWLPTGPARWSGLVVPRPLLVVFYHVEKTGGSAVMKWLHKMASTKDKVRGVMTPRLTSLFDFTHTSCLFAQHSDLFPGYRDAWDDRRCTAPTMPRWQTAAAAVEFHAYTRRRYWEDFAPKLPILRARYAAANGMLLTFTMLREPVSHIMSTYKMWPPSVRCKEVSAACPVAGKHPLSLPSWLPRAVGLQAGSFTLDSWPHLRRGFHNVRGCDVLAQGRERLTTFDLVGIADCTDTTLSRVCALLGWPCDQDRSRMTLALTQALRAKPHGVSPGGVMAREGLAFFEAARLNATIQHDIAVAARCDRAIYEDAIRRTGLPVPTNPEGKLNRSLCPLARFVSSSGHPLLGLG